MDINMMDMLIESQIDDTAYHPKLTKEDVKEIKYMLKYKPERGLAIKLAQQYNCTPMRISDIKRGIIWKHIKVNKEF